MTSPLSGVGEMILEQRRANAKAPENSLEALTRVAALKNEGYDVTNEGGRFGISQNQNMTVPPGFVRVGGKVVQDPMSMNPLEQARMKNLQTGGVFGGFNAAGDPVPNQTPEERLAMLSPEDQAMVKGLASYDIDPNSLSSRNNKKGVLVGLAKELNPTYSSTEYPAKASYKKDFSSGKRSQNVLAANTLIKHMGSLEDTLTGLPSSRFGVVEAGQRFLENKMNATGPANVAMGKEDMALNAVAGELSNVFKQSGSTDEEIKSWLNSYDRNAPREVKQAKIQEAVKLLKGRVGEIGNEYERTMGSKYGKDLISPEAQGVLKRIAPDEQFGVGQPTGSQGGGDMVIMTAPDGSKVPVHRSRMAEAQQDGLK